MRMSRRAGLLLSGTNEFIWDVYNASYGYTVIEQSGESGGQVPDKIYVGSSYSLNQSTGVFTVSQTIKIDVSSSGASTALNKYFIPDGGYYPATPSTAIGDVIYQIISASYTLFPSRLTLALVPIVSEYYEYKGSLVNSVTSSVLTTYPVNGIQGNYWYVLRNKVTQASISYSGNYTDEIVNMDDNYYRLLTFTSSGTLSLDRSLKGDVWICGGGGSGYQYSTSSAGSKGDGGAGAYTDESTNSSIKDIVITIGAGYGGNSSISGDITLLAYGGNKNSNGSSITSTGGTGAGYNTYGSSIGKGDGIEKTPFSSSYFEYPYCDGGGSGGIKSSSSQYNSRGGAGGTNGADGNYKVTGYYGYAGGAGGGHYGGAGSSATSGTGNNNGSNATGYGSGGGGGSYYYTSDKEYTGYGGYGYQGVCFIRFSL